MEDANEDAETETKDAAVAEENCKTCKRDECIELEKKMKDEMYANKRAPGGKGKHGLNLRRAEQICGANGPGTRGWDTHFDEIANQQDRLGELLGEYYKKQCKGHPDQNINLDEAQRMSDDSFNPSPGDWLGPNHPSCAGIKDMIKQNPTPQLPNLPRPPKPSGVPTS